MMILPSISRFDSRVAKRDCIPPRARTRESRALEKPKFLSGTFISIARQRSGNRGKQAGQRRKSRRGYSEVVVEGRFVCSHICVLKRGSIINGPRKRDTVRLYDESSREVSRIEFRRSNRGRRLVPKSRSRLLGLVHEMTRTGLVRPSI